MIDDWYRRYNLMQETHIRIDDTKNCKVIQSVSNPNQRAHSEIQGTHTHPHSQNSGKGMKWVLSPVPSRNPPLSGERVEVRG